MSITIEKLRIIPYTQKDTIKAVFGDALVLSFSLPDHEAGDTYTLALDYERVLLPTMRPVCALATEYTASGTDITMVLDINTERFAQWASRQKKPMPIWLQLQRERDGVYTTLLIDDILALPTVIDGANTVFPGTPLQDELDAKLDKPAEPGQPGQVLKLDADGSSTIWATGGGGGDAVWGGITGDLADQTDLQEALASKADLTSGVVPKSQLPAVEWADIEDKPTIPTVGSGIITITQGGTSKGSFSVNQTTAQTIEIDAGGAASWDEIQGKPSFATVATTGAYRDLTGTPTIPADVPAATASQIDARASAADIRPSNLEYAVRSVLPGVTVIPPSSTTYMLYDAASTVHGHCDTYTHAPTAAPTYTLPAVTDTSVFHSVILTVDFSTVQTIAFEDAAGVVIVPLDTLAIAAGDVVEYLCRYDTMQGKWSIACGKLNQ